MMTVVADVLSLLAMVTSMYLYVVPLSKMKAAWQMKEIGKVPLLPFICMALNSLLWGIYGFAVWNSHVFATAVFGFSFASYYLVIYYFLVVDKDEFAHVLMIAALFFIGIVFYLVEHRHQAPYNIGVVASGINILLYGSPAAELPMICRTGNTESMPLGYSFASFVASMFWWAYGIVIDDQFLIWPNAIGAAFGIMQLWTIFFFVGGEPDEVMMLAEIAEYAETARLLEDEEADQLNVNVELGRQSEQDLQMRIPTPLKVGSARGASHICF